MSKETIGNLIEVFKIIATVGFLGMSVLIVALSYRGYKKFLKDDEDLIKKYRWLYVLMAILIMLLLGFIYSLLFLSDTAPNRTDNVNLTGIK